MNDEKPIDQEEDELLQKIQEAKDSLRVASKKYREREAEIQKLVDTFVVLDKLPKGPAQNRNNLLDRFCCFISFIKL